MTADSFGIFPLLEDAPKIYAAQLKLASVLSETGLAEVAVRNITATALLDLASGRSRAPKVDQTLVQQAAGLPETSDVTTAILDHYGISLPRSSVKLINSAVARHALLSHVHTQGTLIDRNELQHAINTELFMITAAVYGPRRHSQPGPEL